MPIINDVLLLSERGEGVFTFRFKLSSHWWRIRDYYRTIFIPGSRTVCPFCHIHCILTKRQRQPKYKHRIDNPVTLATLSTKDEVNTKTNNTQKTNKLSNTDPNENTERTLVPRKGKQFHPPCYSQSSRVGHPYVQYNKQH